MTPKLKIEHIQLCDARKTKWEVRERKSHGFALIVAITLMAFILLLLLSLSSLVRIESATGALVKSQSEAEQNALFALKNAVGELQKVLGPDQRVSAQANILANSHETKQYLTGVWSSDPNPVMIDGNTVNKGETIAWLVSDATDTSHNTSPSPQTSAPTAVTLLGAGSLRDADNNGVADNPLQQVVINKTDIRDENSNVTGRFAWWIDDEGVKAKVNFGDRAANLTGNAEKHASVLLYGNGALGQLQTLSGLSDVDMQNNSLARRIHNLSDIYLGSSNAEKDEVAAYYHDLTTTSFGVLSDARHGGLKKDLSLAFEMSDAAFNSSEFGAGGPDTISSPGFGRVQPIFRLENSSGVKANGPTWHLLRDFYTIYHRLENPLTDPTFQAQAFLPNRSELNSATSWEGLAAMRFIAPGAYNNPTSQGDPLRTDGDQLPVLVQSSYLPYVLRNIVTMGIRFYDVPPPSGYSGPYEFRRMKLLLNPAFVIHNPYNVRLSYNGLASYIDHLRFRIGFESLLDPTIDTEIDTQGNWHMFKTGPGTLEPGELKVFSGIHHTATGYSSVGLPTAFWEPTGAAAYNIDIPVDPATGGPNLRLTYKPFGGNQLWVNYAYHLIAAAVGESVSPSLTGLEIRAGSAALSNYGGHDSRNVSINFSEWYGGVDSAGRVLNTENYRESDNAAPYPFLNYDLYVKPAVFDVTNNRYPYPVYSHTNPVAPIMQSRNLFRAHPFEPVDYGWPMYSPGRQLNIFTSSSVLTPGADVLQTFGENAFWGNSITAGGSTHVPVIELPTSPLQSIGALQHANVGLYGHQPALAIGNSYASPFIERDQVYGLNPNVVSNERIFYDLSYLLNDALWDSYFFSTYSIPYDPANDDYNANADNVADSFDIAFGSDDADSHMAGSLPNPRMSLTLNNETRADVREKLFDGAGSPRNDAYQRAAHNLMISGAFNVNSTSVDAWKAILSATRNRQLYLSGKSNSEDYTDNTTPILRISQPTKSELAGNHTSSEAWGGFSTLSDNQIGALASAIVDELKNRVNTQGHPYLWLSKFVNRKLENSDEGLSGLLQAAIENSGINSEFIAPETSIDASDLSSTAGSFPNATNINGQNSGERNTALSSSAQIIQGDILQKIGSFITTRSDTFRIRAYGEAVNPLSGEATGRAWCEAVVQRIPEPATPASSNDSDINYWEPAVPESLGRKFIVTDFRWLSEDEI